jgi:hypothetical protein
MTDFTCGDLAAAEDNPTLQLAYGIVVAGLLELIDLEMAIRDGEPPVTKTLTPSQQDALARHMSTYSRVFPDAPVVDAVRSGVASIRDAVLPRRKPSTTY